MAANQDKKKEKKVIRPRVSMPVQPALARARVFSEVALGYTAEMAMEEASRCLQCKKPVCVKGCPVEVPIKGFIGALLKEGVEAAYHIIKTTNSLPAVCGRVCPQETQCEGFCVLGKKGQPVAIGRLERYVADTYMARSGCDAVSDKPECRILNPDLKVACIGSGPSSLTAAGYLASRGIKVTIFEALHELGGVLVYGIPEFRLPKSIVRAEIEALRELHVELSPNIVVGKTVEIKELFEQGYKAAYIAVGAGLPRFLRVPGENLIGVFSANEYLTRVNLGRAYDFPNYDTPIFPGKHVAVFGGGNVAMDAARTALRLGAETARIVYRRTREEMPARREEVEHAHEEGVIFECLYGPIEFHGDEKGFLKGVRLQKMRLGEPDASGRCAPVCVEGEFCEMECDLAVVAVGTGPNRVLLEATPELGLNKWGYIIVNEETGETSIPNVFAGGDIVTGAATVISAMGAGRRAGKEIAKRLLGESAA
jgi:glutamate synthase (NADPH/NADH) small chain